MITWYYADTVQNNFKNQLLLFTELLLIHINGYDIIYPCNPWLFSQNLL
jgi:hypothetical protein